MRVTERRITFYLNFASELVAPAAGADRPRLKTRSAAPKNGSAWECASRRSRQTHASQMEACGSTRGTALGRLCARPQDARKPDFIDGLVLREEPGNVRQLSRSHSAFDYETRPGERSRKLNVSCPVGTDKASTARLLLCRIHRGYCVLARQT